MELREAINNRKSVRGYLDKPVEKETLIEVLKLATRAVSALNAQPWRFIILTGDVKNRIAEINEECFVNREQEDIGDPPLDGVYRRRRIDVAKQLFTVMEIAREDTEKRDWWTRRGFRFFDAPAVILMYLEEGLDETASRFDFGAVAQNICLAAMEYGLATCVENQSVAYQRGVKEVLGLPDNIRFEGGIAIGYEDPDFPANKVRTERADVEDISEWYGF